jgi:hypothetical protein
MSRHERGQSPTKLASMVLASRPRPPLFWRQACCRYTTGILLVLIDKYVDGYGDSDKQEDYPSKSHTHHVNYVKHGHSLIPLPKIRVVDYLVPSSTSTPIAAGS